MELSGYRSFLSFRSRGLAVPNRLLQTWSSTYMKRHHPDVDWRASIRCPDGREDHLILAHMRDAAEVEVADDVNAAAEVEEWINPLYAAPQPDPMEAADASDVDEEGEASEDDPTAHDEWDD
ncbi:unnamed protein product [Closterium sp. Naga37s-1]|nr:unnamed protein product [Closterium sp. Naga37s-1]